MIIHSCRRRGVLVPAFALLFVFIFTQQTIAQTPLSGSNSSPDPQSSPTPTDKSATSLEKNFFKNILRDQRAIWTSPFHMNRSDAKWGIPLTISTAALLATDRHTSGELVENGDNLKRLRISRHVSQLGAVYTTGGVALGFYLTGRATHNDRARETGLLATEALLNGSLVGEALKVASQRQRPPKDDSSGEFFDGGSSFPSGHAISAWSVATVIAKEYGRHRPLIQVAAYGLASAVSISRYTGRNHFLSDVLIGSVIGYGIGNYVYHQHHDPALESLSKKRGESILQSKLFPQITPIYAPRARAYGGTLAWNF